MTKRLPREREPFVHNLNLSGSGLANCNALRCEDLAAFDEANDHSTLARKLRHIQAHRSAGECFREEHVATNAEYLDGLSAVRGRCDAQGVACISHVGLCFDSSSDSCCTIVATENLFNRSSLRVNEDNFRFFSSRFVTARNFGPPPDLRSNVVDPLILVLTVSNTIRIQSIALAFFHFEKTSVIAVFVVVAIAVHEFNALGNNDFARAGFFGARRFFAGAGFFRAGGFFAGARFFRARRFFAGARFFNRAGRFFAGAGFFNRAGRFFARARFFDGAGGFRFVRASGFNPPPGINGTVVDPEILDFTAFRVEHVALAFSHVIETSIEALAVVVARAVYEFNALSNNNFAGARFFNRAGGFFARAGFFNRARRFFDAGAGFFNGAGRFFDAGAGFFNRARRFFDAGARFFNRAGRFFDAGAGDDDFFGARSFEPPVGFLFIFSMSTRCISGNIIAISIITHKRRTLFRIDGIAGVLSHLLQARLIAVISNISEADGLVMSNAEFNDFHLNAGARFDRARRFFTGAGFFRAGGLFARAGFFRARRFFAGAGFFRAGGFFAGAGFFRAGRFFAGARFFNRARRFFARAGFFDGTGRFRFVCARRFNPPPGVNGTVVDPEILDFTTFRVEHVALAFSHIIEASIEALTVVIARAVHEFNALRSNDDFAGAGCRNFARARNFFAGARSRFFGAGGFRFNDFARAGCRFF